MGEPCVNAVPMTIQFSSPLPPASVTGPPTRDPFETLLAPHVGMLWGTAYRYTGNRADAEDLLQELFVRIYPRRQELAALENLRGWLLRSLYNLFIDTRRSWSRNVLSRLARNGDEMLGLVESGAAGPEEEALADSRRQEIFRHLDRLDADQRAVLVMHDMEDRTLPELAELLDVPIGTLKSRLFRARRRMRALLGGNLSAAGDVVEDEGDNT